MLPDVWVTGRCVLACVDAFVRCVTRTAASHHLLLPGFGLFPFRKMLSPLHRLGPLLCLRALSPPTSYPVSPSAPKSSLQLPWGGPAWRGQYESLRFVLGPLHQKKNRFLKSHSSARRQLRKVNISNLTQ